MTAKDRRRHAHRIMYELLQRAIDNGFVSSGDNFGESEADQVEIGKIIDKWTQLHYNRSDK